MAGEVEQGLDLHAGTSQAFGAMQVRKINYKQGILDYPTSPAQKLCGGKGRSTRCNEIIHNDYALLVVNGTGIDFQPVAPIFQGIVYPDGGNGQFPRLADGHKADPEMRGNGGTEDEAACLDPSNDLGMMAGSPIRKVGDTRRKPRTVGNQRRNIAEQDPCHRKVRHGAYKVLQIVKLHIQPLRPRSAEQ